MRSFRNTSDTSIRVEVSNRQVTFYLHERISRRFGNFNFPRCDDKSFRRVIATGGIKRYAAGKLNRKWKVVKVLHSSRGAQTVDEVIIVGMRSGEYGE